MISFKNVSKTYPNGTRALVDFNLEIEPGEFVFILGASGAGKSTFLKLIMREEVPSSGEININGTNLNTIKPKKIPYFRRKLGIVFQDFRLIPNMKVYDNVAFAMRAIGEKEKIVNRRVTYALSLVGLSSKINALPSELSGGEQQRVALARALVNKADIIIADEPTGNIDPEMSYEIVDLLNHINKNGTTVIMVTHEHELVRRFNNRVVTIKNGGVYSDTKHPELAPAETEGTVETTTKMGEYYHDPSGNESIYSSVISQLGSGELPGSAISISDDAFTKSIRNIEPEKIETDIIDLGTSSGISKPSEAEKIDFSKYFEQPGNNGGDGNEDK